MNTARNIYDLLLSLYPRNYRQVFGAQMMQTFIDDYADAKSSERRVGMQFWLFAVTDEIKNILRQHVAALSEDKALLRIAVVKLVGSTLLLIPLFVVFFMALISAALHMPHPSVSGIGFLLAFAALILLSGVLSIGASYLLVSVILRTLSPRKIRIS